MSKEHIIKIPHLGDTTIVVSKKLKGDLDDADGYAKRMCAGEYELVVRLPIKGKVTAAHLVHEIIHILQYIVEDNHMDFLNEREHMAYIAGYLFEEVCKI